MKPIRAALLVAPVLLAACDLDLERMTDQPRFTAYEECAACPAGTIMMTPPAGAVARDAQAAPEIAPGRSAGVWIDRIPIRLDRAVLDRGRTRFDIFCAACHGRLGNGLSQVAENMTLREPRSLLVPPVADYPVGRLYSVITEGYGLMRSYAGELPAVDRWAVVAYLEALQLAQRIELDRLTPRMRQEGARWLR
jgi:mono/diheme cytochrome c family protein